MSILDEAVAAAGVDPRPLHRQLMAGQPERTIELARAFEEAGQAAREAYRGGRAAHGGIADGFSNGAAPVLDAEAQSRRAWQLLGQGGQDMEDTATFLKRSVTALDAAQADSAGVIDRMTAELNALAAAYARQPGTDPAAARQQTVARAAAVVRAAAGEIQRLIDTYDRGLARDAAELAARGYVPAAPGPTVPGTGDPAGGPFAARFAGGVGALGDPTLAAPALVPTAPDPYRGLSPANGLLTAGDVVGGLNGARLETNSHLQKQQGLFLKETGEQEAARLRAQQVVTDPDRFYRDLDHNLARIQQGDDLVRTADDLKKTSKVLPVKVGGGLALAGIGYDIATGKDPVQAVAAGGGGFLASVGAGAAVGAAFGSFAPGVGTAVGAVVGAGVGVFTSGVIDGLFEDGPDVMNALGRGGEAVLDTGGAVVSGVKAVGAGIAGLFD